MCGPENVNITKSQVLCSASPWFSPVTPGSPTAARHLTAACVIAGFVDRDIAKWLITRRRLAFNSSVRLVQKWFRGVCFSRLALRLLAPFVGSHTTALMPLWCVHHVHIAWIQTGPDKWSQWVLSFQARTLRFLNSADLSSMPTTVRRQQMARFDGCRRWPWSHKIHAQSDFQMASPNDCKSFHSLVNPLWASSFWRNVGASLKYGVRLAHKKISWSHHPERPFVLELRARSRR